jgi:D-alanyl-D-alanine carboxypeptidase
LRDEMCGGHRKRPASDEDEDMTLAASGSGASGESPAMFFTSGLQPPMPKASEMLAGGPAASEPMVVYTGPKKTGPALIAAVATDSEKQAPAKRGKRSRVAAVKPDAGAAPKTDAKSDGKPVRHASAKPDAVAKPAKPKAAAKPKTDAKTDTKPAG